MLNYDYVILLKKYRQVRIIKFRGNWNGFPVLMLVQNPPDQISSMIAFHNKNNSNISCFYCLIWIIFRER